MLTILLIASSLSWSALAGSCDEVVSFSGDRVYPGKVADCLKELGGKIQALELENARLEKRIRGLSERETDRMIREGRAAEAKPKR